MGKFGWHYPPGAANDPNAPYNQPDHSHDHEWEPVNEYPEFEDGAAIFMEYCRYAEGRYGDGWKCEEYRRYRCELDRIVKIRDGKPDIAYLAIEEDTDQFRHIEGVFEDALISVEMAKYNELEIEDLDPPNGYNDGFVQVRFNQYRLVYEQKSENCS